MLRLMQRRLLCNGDVSRARDGPAFLLAGRSPIVPSPGGIGWLAWQVALQAGAFVIRNQKRTCEEASMCEGSRVRDGSAFCFSGAV
jgi:hypothetical protein